MPIKVTCACGQSFAAKDELAGRTVKCPKCSRPLTIPASGAPAAPSAPAVANVQPVATPVAPGPAPAAQPSGSLFDEVGIESAPAGSAPCPGCRTPLPLGAVLCVQCGYNVKLGRRMETMRVGADGEAGHTSVTDMLLSRAARSLEDDKEEERKKTREGLPWWAYLLLLLGLSGFMALMMLIPQKNAIFLAGYTIMFVGWALCLYSGICILIVAFKENPLQGILCLFVVPGCPIYTLIFIITRWEQCAAYFFMNLGGTVLMFVGLGVIFVAAWVAANQDEALMPLVQHGVTLAQLWHQSSFFNLSTATLLMPSSS